MDAKSQGERLRNQAKELVLHYMKNSASCSTSREGIRVAELFRICGLDWGNQENATSSHQQYWLVALLRQLESDGTIQRDVSTKKWRLK